LFGLKNLGVPHIRRKLGMKNTLLTIKEKHLPRLRLILIEICRQTTQPLPTKEEAEQGSREGGRRVYFF